jgi:hypothetical protein
VNRDQQMARIAKQILEDEEAFLNEDGMLDRGYIRERFDLTPAEWQALKPMLEKPL